MRVSQKCRSMTSEKGDPYPKKRLRRQPMSEQRWDGIGIFVARRRVGEPAHLNN